MTATKGEEKKIIEATFRTVTLLKPAAKIEELVDSFKLYVELRDKLLEDTDYVWSVSYKAGSQESREFFQKREAAEKFMTGLTAKGIHPDLEKKVKKSGCLKLGKAFAISVEILEEVESATGFKFKVRASAPNGQAQERTGRCDRAEKGRANSPLDHMEATALTRATNRAIMALLGGETTAEEFEESEQPKPAPAAVTPQPSAETEQLKKDLDAHFVDTKPALDHRTILVRKMFAMAREVKFAEAALKALIKGMWKLESTKDMTVEQIGVVLKMLEGKKQKGAK